MTLSYKSKMMMTIEGFMKDVGGQAVKGQYYDQKRDKHMDWGNIVNEVMFEREEKKE